MSVLAPDVALPARDVLLSASAMAERLGASKCRLLRVNYKPGRSLRVAYEIERFSTYSIIGCHGFAGHRRPEAAPGLILDAELNAVFWTFPNDRRIAHLPAALGRWPRSRLVAYAPEKSATLQCFDAHCAVTAYAKVSHRPQERQLVALEALRQSLADGACKVRLPRVIERSADGHTLVFEPLPGLCLADNAAAVAQNEDLAAFGEALAQVHTIPGEQGPPFVRFSAGRLRQAAAAIGLVRPDLSAAAVALANSLLSTAPPQTESVWLHGDVHLKNALVDDGSISLIDFEDSAIGPPAADLASLLAELRYQQRIAAVTDADGSAAAQAFLAGYDAIRRLPDWPSLVWHIAAALLVERAVGAIHRVRGDGLDHLDELLNDAASLVAV